MSSSCCLQPYCGAMVPGLLTCPGQAGLETKPGNHPGASRLKQTLWSGRCWRVTAVPRVCFNVLLSVRVHAGRHFGAFYRVSIWSERCVSTHAPQVGLGIQTACCSLELGGLRGSQGSSSFAGSRKVAPEVLRGCEKKAVEQEGKLRGRERDKERKHH